MKETENFKKSHIFRQAFSASIPVLCGYVFMGAAFGLLLQQAGYNFLWALFMSIIIFAGTMQYMAIPFLVAQTDLVTVAITTLLVHFRHFVYGLSFIETFKSFGKRKYYMMFAMTDETYALLCMAKASNNKYNKDELESYMFYVSLLDHLYWITGCVLGALAGSLITFNTEGIDFAMTALFIVICVEQWKTAKTKIPTFLGFGIAIISLIIFGADNMLIPSIVLIVTMFIVNRPKLENLVMQTEEI